MNRGPSPTPIKEFRDWFERDAKSGHWFAIMSADIGRRIDVWRRGRGKNRWWNMTPRDRRAAGSWIAGRHRITWAAILRLCDWSNNSPYYWLGPKPKPSPLRRVDPLPPKNVEPPSMPEPEPEPEPEPAPEPAPAGQYNFFEGVI